MVTRLLLISDTHVPQRARRLPEQVWRAVDEADLVLHAGDWVDLSLYEELTRRAPALLGVFGNNDGADLRRVLPEIARDTIEGVRFAMIHETGAATGRQKRMDEAFPDTDVLVFGHSHIPWDSVSPRGLRLLNPGSPTDRRQQPAHTYLTAVADNGQLTDVTLVPVLPDEVRRG
ncbi:metallophosphoesterase family protein [Cryobacterium sp. TMT4-31]|uniref:metallophosphoesterase family protein n=1 Tax=Cryobacterium sp. TMT4-31 TaxID=1259259 RepID=UPI00106DD187|nr:metallophosphoesterase [Cryobacterium sp. TMT4-31]TFC90848.1 metallophosphoesterase [Cryobacterium sp. TMT4-31]